MDPQQAPSNQPAPTPGQVPVMPGSTSPAPAPAPAAAPQVAPSPVVSQAPAPISQLPPSPVGPAGSSKKMLFGVIGGAAVVIVALVAGWFLYFSPAAQAERLSDSFMNSITTGNVDKAVALAGDNSAKDFLTAASKNVHGSYKMSQSEFKDSKGYYLYTLSGANRKYARTIIEKDSGKLVVGSFVFSSTTLALVPSSTSASSTTSSDTPEPTATATAATGCLTPDDFSYFSGVGDLTPFGTGGYEEFYQLEFNPNVATYAPGDFPDPTTVFNDFKQFYASVGNSKKYVIELESSVNSASPDESLADARNAKVESDLETISGIPASKLTLTPVRNDTSDSSTGNSFYRQVQITLRSDPSCVQ